MAESREAFEELGHERFSIVFRGYDRDEVDAYIAELEEVARAIDARPGALSRGELAELLGDEIGGVLAAAEEAAQTIREQAQKESDEVLTASKSEAEKVLNDALARTTTAHDEADKIVGEKRREAELIAERLENAARRRHDEIIQEAVERNKLLKERERELLDRIDALEKAFLSMRHTADDIYKNVASAAPATKETKSQSATPQKARAKTTDRSKVVDLTDSFDDDAEIVDVAPTKETKRPKRA
jgi:cell division initiation protein